MSKGFTAHKTARLPGTPALENDLDVQVSVMWSDKFDDSAAHAAFEFQRVISEVVKSLNAEFAKRRTVRVFE